MKRSSLGPVVAALLCLAVPAPAFAASTSTQFTPYTIEPVEAAIYDDETEYAFYPSKGIHDYEGKELLPGGLIPKPGSGRGGPSITFNTTRVKGEDLTKNLFTLIKIRVTNFESSRGTLAFDAKDFYMESPRGAVYSPHPFTVATTRRNVKPGEAVYMTLGFDVPQGTYTLIYKDRAESGKQIISEIWRYDISINRGPLAFVGRATVGLLISFLTQIFRLIDGILGSPV